MLANPRKNRSLSSRMVELDLASLASLVVASFALGAAASKLGAARERSSLSRPRGSASAFAWLVERVLGSRARGQSLCCAGGSAPAVVPRHVAVIMDGNRRYGRLKHNNPMQGHWDGGQTLVECVKWCLELGIEVLTVYAFSTENWNRDAQEVEVLMNILCKYCAQFEEEATKNNIRVKVLSTDRERLPPSVAAAIAKLESSTRAGTGLLLNMCISYGGRGDVVRSCKRLCESVQKGETTVDGITEEQFAMRLETAGMPDPDLLIRTSGEYRLSNFLLFQLAYTELAFVEKFWPEITKADFVDLLSAYSSRQRRYGG